MKWSFYFTGALIFVLTLSQTINVFANDTALSPEPSIEHIDTARLNEFNGLLNTMMEATFDQTQKIISTLDDLVQYINNSSVKVANPKNTRKYIQSLKILINAISDPKHFIPLNLQSIDLLLTINTGLIDHVNTILDNKLTKLPTIEPENFIKRSMLDLDIDDIQKKLLIGQKAAESLKLRGQNYGLSYVNKGYRLLSDDFNFWSKSAKAASIGAIGILALYMIPKRIFNDFTPSDQSPFAKIMKPIALLKEKIGEKTPMLQIGNDIVPSGDISSANKGILRKIEDTLGRSGITYGGLGITLTLKDLIGNNIKQFILTSYKKTKLQLTNLHHKLRGSNIKVIDANEKEIINYDQINADLIGLDWAKEEFESAISYICDPDRYDRYDTPIPKGFLLTGSPGTGKTEFARWVCAEINHRLTQENKTERAGFINVAWHELFGGNGLKEVIEKAKKKAPCIIFIDEIDTIGLQRDRYSQLLNEVLQELSGINTAHDKKKQIIFIAATNKPEHIDPAMRRSGRFGKEILFPLPDFEKRIAFFDHQQKNYAIDPARFDSTFLAEQTAEKSFADLNQISNDAVLDAKQHERPLSFIHFQKAIDKINGLTNSKTISPSMNTVMSTYIAGRTAAHLLLEVDKVTSATIRPKMRKIKEQAVYEKQGEEFAGKNRITFGKVFTFNSQEVAALANENDIKNKILLLLAGHTAEELILGSSYYTHHENDKMRALVLATKLKADGLDFKKIPEKIRNSYILEAQKLIEQCHKEIKMLLKNNLALVESLTNKLKTNLTLYGPEITKIYDDYLIN